VALPFYGGRRATLSLNDIVVGAGIGSLAASGKPLICFLLLFHAFSCFFQKKQKKYEKAQSSTF